MIRSGILKRQHRMNMNSNDSPPLRVLQLEDAASDAELALAALRHAGVSFVAERVDTRTAFIDALGTFLPDVVLADYKLPSFDGREALEIVRRDHPHVPVIVVTGTLGDEAAIEMLKAGAKDYVFKDNLVRLGSAVRRAYSEELGVRQRKAAERAVRESEARYRLLFETAQDGIVIVHADTGAIEDVNPFLTSLTGYSHDELVGRTLWEHGLFLDTDTSRRTLAALRRNEDIHSEDLQLLTRDGRNVEIEFVGNVVIDENTRIIRCNIRDISGRLAAQRQLHEQLAELQRFQKVTVGRELRMQELTEEIRTLRKKLDERRDGS